MSSLIWRHPLRTHSVKLSNINLRLPVDPERPHRWLVAFLIALLVGLADQGAKWLAVRFLAERSEPFPLVGSWITLRLTHNTGAALSLGDNRTLLVTILSQVVIFVLTLVMFLTSSRAWAYTLAVVIGGGSGNIVDRHMGDSWGTGAVTDFIDYFGLFVGNVADIFVVIGMILVFRLLLKNVPIFGYETSEDAETGDEIQMAPHEPVETSETTETPETTTPTETATPAGGKNK